MIITLVLERKDLNDWESELRVNILGSIISYITYKYFITQTTNLFLSVEEIKNLIWVSIVTFLFVLYRDYIYENLELDSEKSEKRSKKYIFNNYEKLKERYDTLIKEKNSELKILVYAVMIYESYNRPKCVRFFEYIKFKICGDATLGIMQVKTNRRITNEESVILGYEKLKKAYDNIKDDELYYIEKIREVLYQYNKSNSYCDEVIAIFQILKEES